MQESCPLGFLTRPDIINQPVQSQKPEGQEIELAIYLENGLPYLLNIGYDQLCSYCIFVFA